MKIEKFNFEYTLKKTTIPAELWENLFEQYCRQSSKGKYNAFCSTLANIEWRWAGLENFETKCIQRGLIPQLWEHFGYKIGMDAKKHQWVLARILEHTIDVKNYSSEIASQLKSLGSGWQARAIETTDCPLEKEYAKKHNNGKSRVRPPFFPGDRTELIIEPIE